MSGRNRSPAARRGSRRAWGWHPLRDQWARQIVAAAPVAAGDLVLDLGAGSGALTRPLVDAGARVVAVELHPGRAAALRERYDGLPVRVIRCDLVRLRLPQQPFRVVASPPYSMSTVVVRALLGSPHLLSADLVLQLATAQRLARDVPAGWHAQAYRLDIVARVPRSAFHPAPRVDSAVVRISRAVAPPR